ncbi:MAG: carbohydrate-binding family 9-like protein, partial [Terriglobia bacterium]
LGTACAGCFLAAVSLARIFARPAAVKSMDTQSGYLSNLQITSQFVSTDFVPDGNLAKPAWSHAHGARFDHSWAGDLHYPEAATEVASLWSGHYVYFAYGCRYSTLNVYSGQDPSKDFWGLWERDVVELFINPQPQRMNHYYEFEVAPNNLWIDLEINLDRKPFNDAGWNSGFEHATAIDAAHHQWTCEMRIPIAALAGANYTPSPGDEWRINFFRADGKGDNEHRRLLAWSPVPAKTANFHTPRRFGIIRFAK